MKIKTIFRICACLVLANSIAKAESTLGLAPVLSHFDYQEIEEGGGIFNAEEGAIAGLKMDYQHKTDRYMFSLNGRYTEGVVDYDGQTQSGVPLSSETDAIFANLGVGFAYAINEAFHATLELSRYKWDRHILSTPTSLGLREKYEWNRLSLGLSYRKKYDFLLGDLVVETAYLQNLDGDLEVNLADLGFGKPSIELAGGKGVKLALSASEEIDDRWTLETGIEYSYSEFERGKSSVVSNAFTAISIFEPASETEFLTLWLGLEYGF